MLKLHYSFLTHSEKNTIISLANKKQGRGASKWPEKNPHWNPNSDPDYTKLCQGTKPLLSAMKTCSNTPESGVKFQQTKQEINKTPSQFIDRLIVVCNTHMDFDFTREWDIRQIQ